MNLENCKKTCSLCEGEGEVYDGAKVGAAMRIKRQESNLTMREVARRMGYSAAYLCDLETGKRNWTKRKIAEYLKVL